MIDLILVFLSPLWGYIAGGLALLLGGWLWKRKNARIERQEQAIKVYEAKEQVHKQDDVTDQETQVRVDELRKKVEDAETPEQGAEEVSGAINDYFSTGEKK